MANQTIKENEEKKAPEGIVETVTETAGNVKSILQGKAKAMVEDASDNWESVRDQANAAVGTLEKTVKKYPFQALLVGFGVGLVMGAAIAATRRS